VVGVRFVLRRLGFFGLTLWAALTLNFFIPRVMPGSPLAALRARTHNKLSPDALQQMLTSFGFKPHQNVFVQYVEYLRNMLTGHWGISIGATLGEPVSTLVSQALPWTLGLVGVATVLSFLIGTSIGTFIGWRRGTRAEIMVPIATFFSTVPYFWLGLIVIALFSSTLRWFPASHAFSKGALPNLSFEFIGDVIYHAALPALTIVITSLGGWILGMRNMMITVLDEDYITVALAKGLSPRRVAVNYAARNAVLPQLSSFALSLGFIVGGTLIMELIFSYPGLGLRLFEATLAKDYPLMQGMFLVITLSVLVANIIADIVYAIMDPRTRQEAV
jgi:peptide/nickel transport system permease protein